jgi:hypothetical protein
MFVFWFTSTGNCISSGSLPQNLYTFLFTFNAFCSWFDFLSLIILYLGSRLQPIFLHFELLLQQSVYIYFTYSAFFLYFGLLLSPLFMSWFISKAVIFRLLSLFWKMKGCLWGHLAVGLSIPLYGLRDHFAVLVSVWLCLYPPNFIVLYAVRVVRKEKKAIISSLNILFFSLAYYCNPLLVIFFSIYIYHFILFRCATSATYFPFDLLLQLTVSAFVYCSLFISLSVFFKLGSPLFT